MLMPGVKIRRFGFWMVDALAGGMVRKFYNQLKESAEEKSDPSSELQNLLWHAAETTEFYKPFRECRDLEEYPIIKKNIIKENYNGFISSAFRGKVLHTMKTSGTSGERFAVLQNEEKRKRVLAELIYFDEQCGFHLGERYLYSRAWFSDNWKSKLVQVAENMLPLECTSLSDSSLQTIAMLLQKDKSIKALKGYATSLGAMADYFERNVKTQEKFHLKAIISLAERLDPSTRARVKKVFGCPVVSRYSNQENGVLAQQDTQKEEFILNTDHYFFEFLHLDHDGPAPAGRPARLVLTDLYNRAMPFIRYDTGDVVVAREPETAVAVKTMLADVSGRCDEIIYDTRGNKLSPNSTVLDFLPFDRVRQYQLVQESRIHFTLKLEGALGVYDDRVFHRHLRNLLGEDAIIAVLHMDRIPRPASGKFRQVVCNLEKER